MVVNNKPAEIPPVFLCGRYAREYSRQPLVMGIVNVTPDSFSDGGAFFQPSLDTQQAIAYALKLIGEGADILDIGGESTRPGSLPVSPQQEMDRVLPVIEGLLGAGVPLSIDTRRPEVMEAAIALGVDIINDINGFRDPRAFRLATSSRCGLCVMHMLGEPQTMQVNPTYANVVDEVWGFLKTQRDALIARGVDSGRIVLDPGFGFGKTLQHNLELLRSVGARSLKYPVLVGVSRKRMIGELMEHPSGSRSTHASSRGSQGVASAPTERVVASVAAALWAAHQGARILRVHDVRATIEALRVWAALEC